MKLKYLHIFPFDNQELSHLHLGSRVPKPVVKVGDKIHFVPGVAIDGCKKAPEGTEPFFKHVLLNVYEFTFRPIMKEKTVVSEDVHFVMHIDYLVELPQFTSYFSEFQFDDDMPFVLEINQLYTSYGKFGVYSFDAFDLMPVPIREKLLHLRINAQVETILDYEVIKTWPDNEDLRVYPCLSESLHNTDEYNDDILYFQDFERFKKTVEPYKNMVKEIATNETSVLPTYCLKIF